VPRDLDDVEDDAVAIHHEERLQAVAQPVEALDPGQRLGITIGLLSRQVPRPHRVVLSLEDQHPRRKNWRSAACRRLSYSALAAKTGGRDMGFPS